MLSLVLQILYLDYLEQHQEIEAELREMVKEKYEDAAVIDTLMNTLRDSVGMVGDLFDTFRKRINDGESR